MPPKMRIMHKKATNHFHFLSLSLSLSNSCLSQNQFMSDVQFRSYRAFSKSETEKSSEAK